MVHPWLPAALTKKHSRIHAVIVVALFCQSGPAFAASSVATPPPVPGGWVGPLQIFSAWRLTAQGMEAMAGLPKSDGGGLYWRALEFIKPATPAGASQLKPLLARLDKLSYPDAAGLAAAMENLATMSNPRPRHPYFREAMLEKLEYARQTAAPAAESQASDLMDRVVVRKREPLGNRPELRRRIREVNSAAEYLLGLSLYGEKIDLMAEQAAKKVEELQTAWVQRFDGAALDLTGFVVGTDGATWSGRTSSGGKMTIKLGRARQNQRRAEIRDLAAPR